MTLRFSLPKAPSRVARLILLLSLLALVLPETARAGGLFLNPLGVEPTARGGARVAGVSDPHALWYNPAGLAYSKRQLLLDFNMPLMRASFRRYLADGTVAPNARANPTYVPIPTLAYSDNFGLERFGFAIGLIVPPAATLAWPEDARAPQRYSILNTDNSVVGSLVLAAAYRPIDALSLGVALYITTAQVGAEVAVSACDYAFCSQPEAPEWQGRTRFLLGPLVTASATFGARYDLDRVRIGASVQMRSKFSGEADFAVDLPNQAFFDDVTLQNEKGGEKLKAEMDFILPTILRVGVEVDVLRPLSVELAYSWENWASQQNIRVRPLGVIARNVPSIGDVRAEPVELARNIQNVSALHLGGTYDLRQLMARQRVLQLHAGAMFETSSFEPRDLSPTTIDSEKLLLGLGASIALVRGLLLDVTYAHVFMKNRKVRNSRVLLPAAIRPLPVDNDPDVYEVGDRPAIGNGEYAVEADFVGLGLRWKIDETFQRPE